MTTELLLALTAFAFVSSITPGPNNLMLMASGVNFGFARTIPHMLGVGVGFVIMILLVGAGLVKIFELFPQAHTVLKVVSCLYLLYLAWKIATSPAPGSKASAKASAKTDAPGKEARPFTFLEAALFQWVNPKAWTMALTAVTAYSIPSAPVLSLLLVALVFGAINLPSVSAWALAGVQLRRFLGDPRKLRIFNITMAVLLVATVYPIAFGQH